VTRLYFRCWQWIGGGDRGGGDVFTAKRCCDRGGDGTGSIVVTDGMDEAAGVSLRAGVYSDDLAIVAEIDVPVDERLAVITCSLHRPRVRNSKRHLADRRREIERRIHAFDDDDRSGQKATLIGVGERLIERGPVKAEDALKHGGAIIGVSKAK